MGLLNTITNIMSGNYGKAGLRNMENTSEEYASRYNPNELIKRIESRSGQISSSTRETCCLALLKKNPNLRQVAEVWSVYYGSKRTAMDQVDQYKKAGSDVFSHALLQKLESLRQVFHENGM